MHYFVHAKEDQIRINNLTKVPRVKWAYEKSFHAEIMDVILISQFLR